MPTRTEEYLLTVRALHLFDARCWIGGIPGPRLPLAPRACSAPELTDLLDRAGIERAVAFHTLARYCRPGYGNALLLEAVAEEPRLVPGAVLVPDESSAREVAALVQRGVRMAALHPASHGFSLEPWCCGELLAALAAHRLPVVLPHTEAPWSALRQLCLDHPDLPVLVEGGEEKLIYHTRTFQSLLGECQNLRLLLHGLVGWRLVEEVVSRHGAGRLLFASHLPLYDPHAAAGLLVWADLSEQEVARIAHGNVDELLAGVRL